MREILFRGKRIDTGEWIYGYLNQHRGDEIMDVCSNVIESGDYYIRDWAEKIDTGSYGCNYKVDPETVGQYTGLTDKNGRKIFEGDVVDYNGYIRKVVFENRFKNARFGIVESELETEDFGISTPPDMMVVIGNIHDNPELLEVKQ